MSRSPTKHPTLSDPRWRLVVSRSAAADGTFFYAVVTTGVYCGPSCGARTPLPDNVRFYASPEEAEAAGYRPCKRCEPRRPPLVQRHAMLVAELCKFIERSERAPTLTQLCERAGLRPTQLKRVFKAATGMTPKAYALAQRGERVRTELRRGGSVTEAVFRAGYASSGRFYEVSNELLGATPTSYRAGGRGMKARFAVGECSLGAVLVAESERGLCALLLGDEPEGLVRDLQDRFPHAELFGGDSEFEATVAQAIGVVDGLREGVELPLELRGTIFQQRVWRALRSIPRGETRSYSELAQALGMPRGARAVASACAANPLAVAVPCHRVVRTDGGLSGYRWGIERKRALIEREAKLERPEAEPGSRSVCQLHQDGGKLREGRADLGGYLAEVDVCHECVECEIAEYLAGVPRLQQKPRG